MESYEILWKSVLKEIENLVSTAFYSTYITQLKPVDVIGNKIVLCTGSELFANTITNMQGDKVREALLKCNSEVTGFSIVIAKDRDEYLKQLGEEAREKMQSSNSIINPKFTFDSYVVGNSNEFVYAAAKAVAENPGEAYNPLYIYGGTGLGKTHILMAVANYLKLYKPSLNVLYTTCEQFTNQMIESVSRGKGGDPAEFHRRFRSVDVLLVDDIQFLANKQATQSEFFNTFNELTLQNKQVVIASDRQPREIEGLEERLKTRFEGGLLADVGKPDLETRIAILKRKAEEQKTIVDLKVLGYIAEMDEGDIRSLMGKLTKVIFASKLHECPITVGLVNDALKECVGENKEELQVDDIINCVCEFYHINKTDLLGKKKNKEISEPRQICIYLITEMMSLPLMTIGEKMGGRDHATIIYSRDKIAEEMKNSTRLATQINDIRKMLLKQ